MDIEKLRTFCLVAHYKNYQEASRAFNITPSTVKKHITSLESAIGFKLIEVVGKKSKLTNKGHIFYPFAKIIISKFDESKILLKNDDKSITGQFTINTTVAFAALWMPEIISDFISQYPNLKLNIIGTDSTPDFSALECDLAIRPFIKDQSGLIQKSLRKYHMELRASVEYIDKNGMPKVPEDLKNHKIISYGKNVDRPYDFIDWYLKYTDDDNKPYININSGIGILKMVENGLGIGPVSLEAAKTSNKKLIKILPELETPSVEMFYIYPKHIDGSLKIKELYKHILSKI